VTRPGIARACPYPRIRQPGYPDASGPVDLRPHLAMGLPCRPIHSTESSVGGGHARRGGGRKFRKFRGRWKNPSARHHQSQAPPSRGAPGERISGQAAPLRQNDSHRRAPVTYSDSRRSDMPQSGRGGVLPERRKPGRAVGASIESFSETIEPIHTSNRLRCGRRATRCQRLPIPASFETLRIPCSPPLPAFAIARGRQRAVGAHGRGRQPPGSLIRADRVYSRAATALRRATRCDRCAGDRAASRRRPVRARSPRSVNGAPRFGERRGTARGQRRSRGAAAAAGAEGGSNLAVTVSTQGGSVDPFGCTAPSSGCRR
jgi:hypothetical protein